MKSNKPDQGRTEPARTAAAFLRCPPGWAYVLGAGLPVAALLVSLGLTRVIGSAPVLMIFLVSIVLCAYVGGWGPGLTATVVSAFLAVYFILPPTHSFQISQGADGLRLALLVVMGLLASSLSEALHRSRRRAEASERLQSVTLASIGDAVIATDNQGRITFLNREAERLTGWACPEAQGQPLASVFRIVCEETRQTVEDPVNKVLHCGSVVGLANHTILIGKSGQETPIDDSGAPIQQADGTVLGVVLVFRDCTETKKVEAAMRERLVLQEKMAKIVSTAPGVICAYRLRPDGSTGIPFASPGLEELYGVRPEDVVADASAFSRAHHPDDDARVKLTIAESARTMSPWHAEFRVRHPQRGELWIEGKSIPEREADGSICWHGSLQDITPRKRAEEALQQLQALYHSLVEQMPAGVFRKDADGRYVFANSHFYQITNTRPEEMLGKLPRDASFPGTVRPGAAAEHHAQILENGQAIEVDEVHRGADGKTRHIHAIKSPVFNPDGKIVGSQGILFDVTQNWQAGEALRESEDRYRTLVIASPDAVTVTNLDGRIEFLSGRALEMFGHALETEVVGRHILNWVAPEDQEKARSNLAYLLANNQLRDNEVILLKQNGQRFSGEINAAPFCSADGRPKGIIFVTRDITERKRAEEAHLRLATAVEQSVEDIVITDAAGKILYVNPAFEANTGYTRQEVISRNPRMLKSGKHDAAFYQQMWAVLVRGDVWSGNIINRKKDGTLFEEESTISPIRDSTDRIISYVSVRRDVTREVAMEAQLRQSQKMEAIGQLAGGIAHDFNNLLTAIRGNASLLLMSPQSKVPEISECSQQIIEAAERAANLTRQLLMFSRKQVVEPVRLDLNEVVAQMTKLLQRILGEDISLVANHAAGLPAIEADAGMMEQILLNLAVNSRDAMPNGGRLTITTATEMLAPEAVGSNPGVLSGFCVRLSVADTGCGIDPENLAHIFEPFFTTKEVGKGTGLGLATVHGIVEQHHGRITVTSKIKQGTTFHIYFPAMAGARLEKAARPMVANLPCGTETILVVEDEVIVRLTVSNMLQRLGYTTLQAESGTAALKVWETDRDRIQLLLTDIVMPDGLTGYELARRLQADRSQLKVIYTSGYSGDLADKRLVLTEGANFLQKPYTPQKLAEAVRRNLDRNGVQP